MSEGWICPLCGRGKAPWIVECDCWANNITTTQTDTEVKVASKVGVNPEYKEWYERYFRQRGESNDHCNKDYDSFPSCP